MMENSELILLNYSYKKDQVSNYMETQMDKVISCFEKIGSVRTLDQIYQTLLKKPDNGDNPDKHLIRGALYNLKKWGNITSTNKETYKLIKRGYKNPDNAAAGTTRKRLFRRFK